MVRDCRGPDLGKKRIQNMPFCLHCRSTELDLLSSPPEITFYECPLCGRQFAQQPVKSLTERWRGPLSLVLYPVIFSERPQDEAVAVATVVNLKVEGFLQSCDDLFFAKPTSLHFVLPFILRAELYFCYVQFFGVRSSRLNLQFFANGGVTPISGSEQ